MNKKTTQILIVVVVIIVAFFGFKYFFVDKQDSGASLVADNKQAEEFAEGQTILLLLNQLKRVSLDDSIFSNKTFISLVSSERELEPQVFERKNPFFPIGIESTGFVSSVTASTTAR
jgi:hypothetical protein